MGGTFPGPAIWVLYRRTQTCWAWPHLVGSMGQFPCCSHLLVKWKHIPAGAILHCPSISLSFPAVRLHSIGPEKNRASGIKDAQPYTTLVQLPIPHRTLLSLPWPLPPHTCLWSWGPSLFWLILLPPSHYFNSREKPGPFYWGSSHIPFRFWSWLHLPHQHRFSRKILTFIHPTFPAPDKSWAPAWIQKMAFHPLKPLGHVLFYLLSYLF